MKFVDVKFTSGYSNQNYRYMCSDDTVAVGDNVVVESPHSGYTVASVVAVLPEDDNLKVRKWVVCKVDDKEYKEREARAKRKAVLEQKLKKSMEKALANMQFEQMAKYMTEEDKTLFEEYKTL